MKFLTTVYLNRAVLALSLILTLSAGNLLAVDKMKPEEIIAKHLESIGTPEARAAVKSVSIIGKVKAVFQGRGGGLAEGVVVVASKGHSYMVGMKFDNPGYEFEKMGFDTENFTVGFASAGKRSVLGDFLQVNRNTFKRGILSGSLSTAWELLDFNEKDAKLRYAGMEKINDKKYHELEYNPKKGTDLSISLYFDPDTFRHVRTKYKRTLSSRQGATVDTSAGQSATNYTLIEDYSDFREENKLTMPHNYRMYLEILTGNGTTSYEWTMDLQRFDFNIDIPDSDFKVDSY